MQSALASRQLARSRPRVVNGSMAPGGLAPAGPLVPLCMHGMGRCLFLLSRSSHRRAARAGGCFPPCSYLLLLAGPPSRCFAFTLSWTLTSTAKCSRVPLLPSGWLGWQRDVTLVCCIDLNDPAYPFFMIQYSLPFLFYHMTLIMWPSSAVASVVSFVIEDGNDTPAFVAPPCERDCRFIICLLLCDEVKCDEVAP